MKRGDKIYVILLVAVVAAFVAAVAVSLCSAPETASQPSERTTEIGTGYSTIPEEGYGGEIPRRVISDVPSPESGETGAVSGMVIATSGKPVIGAHITAYGQKGRHKNTITDERGSYRIKGLSPALYEVEARAEGYATSLREFVKVDADEVTEGVDFVLGKGGRVLVKIIDRSGEPLERSRVLLLPDRRSIEEPSRPQRRQNGYTAADGTVVFDFVQPGAYRLQVRHPGYLAPREEVVVEVGDAEEVTEEIVLEKGATVSGVLMDGLGTPLAGGYVSMSGTGAYKGRLRYTSKASGADGEFNIIGVEGASYTFVARRNGYISARMEYVNVSAGEDLDGLEFTLDEGESISGFAVDESGDPVSGVKVFVYWNFNRSSSYAMTDNSGAFRVTGIDKVSEGRDRLAVRAAKRGYVSAKADSVEIGTNDLTLTLKKRPKSERIIDRKSRFRRGLRPVRIKRDGRPQRLRKPLKEIDR